MTIKGKEVTGADVEAAQFREAVVEVKRHEQGSVLETLDMLRRTRAARGGPGEPLRVPGHLRAEAALIITDADVDDALKNR